MNEINVLNETKAPILIKFNGREISAQAGESVLLAARRAGYDIPTLCYLKDINEVSACRLCLVEVELNGRPLPNLQTACSLLVQEGLSIKSNTERVRRAVRLNLELILANHDGDCLSCIRNGCCELQSLCASYGVGKSRFAGGSKRPVTIDELSWSLVRDSSKCILCGRCVSTCSKVQGLSCLSFTNRGFKTEVAPAFAYSMRDVNCIYCGQCIEACPVAALHERSYLEEVLRALEDPEKVVIIQTAPAVRASLGEEFGYPIGTAVTGKMVAALRRLGFDRVFDTNFAADLTIMEEGTELIGRLQKGGPFPLITSCSPGWVRYCELYYPDFLPNLSSCKSPQQMMGAVIKSYFAAQEGLDPSQIVSVSIMPCTSKKTEAKRAEMQAGGYADIDISLTTRELGALIKQAGIIFAELPDETPDSVLGAYTGAAVIFGASGGVMEAALRTAADLLTGQDLPQFEYEAVRGLAGIKECQLELPLNGELQTLKLAVASSAAQAGTLLEKVRRGEAFYHFIEIMACPGGCIHGGGQSYVSAKQRLDQDPRVGRAAVLYAEDQRQELHKSYQNPDIQQLYKEFFQAPGSELAHQYLHTHYHARQSYPLEAAAAAGEAQSKS